MNRMTDISITHLDQCVDTEILDILKDAADTCEDLRDFSKTSSDFFCVVMSQELPNEDEPLDDYILETMSVIFDDIKPTIDSVDKSWKLAMVMFNCAALALPDKFWKSTFDYSSSSFMLGAFMDDDTKVAVMVECDEIDYSWFKTPNVLYFSDELVAECTSLFDPASHVFTQNKLESECALDNGQFVLHYPNGDRVKFGDRFFASAASADAREKSMELTAVTIDSEDRHYLYSGNTGYSLSVCEPDRHGMQTTYNVSKRDDEFECAKCHKKIEVAYENEIVYCPFCGRRII